MPTFAKGSFKFSIPMFAALSGDFSDEDRQVAWELYVELVTRIAVRGKTDRGLAERFDGEVWVESLDSGYAFFQEARKLLRRYPVGRIGRQRTHLGYSVASLLEVVLRPFLEKWHADLRHFWATTWEALDEAERPHPWAAQETYPHAKALKEDWAVVRSTCRSFAQELAKQYGFPDIAGMWSFELEEAWGALPRPKEKE